jgi:rhodanese-related sulfurtransferase/TusA-related sulfurtransferase
MIDRKTIETDEFMEVDACGISCPGPLNALIQGLENLTQGKKLKIYATDPGFKSSVEAYVKLNESVSLLKLGKEEGRLVAILEKNEITSDELEAPIKVKKKSRTELRGPDAPALSEINVDELYERLGTVDCPAIIVDVREPKEYQNVGHIKDAKLIPLGKLVRNVELLNEYKDKEIVILCAVGGRSMMAAQLLVREGYKDVRNLSGGIRVWQRKGYPLEREHKYHFEI